VAGLDYRAVVFAGGGNRSGRQGGFWDTVRPAGAEPAVVTAVSAGACIAALALGGAGPAGLEHMKRVTAANPKNFHPGRLLRGRNPFPHPAIYGQALESLLDRAALERIQAGPELRVLLARPPAGLPSGLAVLLGFACYTLEKHLRQPLHPRLPLKLGFKPLTVSAAGLSAPQELWRLILASSATPPILPAMRWQGRTVVDGGLIDNVPVVSLSPGERPALVLLTRRYPPAKLAGRPGFTYVQPSRPVPAGKWDYTDPDGLQAAYDLGCADGRRFLAGGPEALQR
jgi:predicted patatin/cPLA2 family phospholipase